ncbi:MAG: nitrogen regulation protein NR(II) [Gammaproteobacteria bacterium]
MVQMPFYAKPPPRSAPMEILDALQTAVIWLSHEGRVTYMNPAAEDLLQLSPKDAVRVRLEVLLPRAPELAATLARARATREICTRRELPLPLGEQEGLQRTVDCTVTPVVSTDQESPELVVELSPLDRHLRITREESLIAQHTASRHLARTLAHEIKNPLGGLRGAAQLLARRLDTPELGEYTSVIIREADRLRDLVDRLLGPARAPRRQPVNVHRILEDIRLLAEAERAPEIEITRDYDPSLPEVTADPEQLTQAVFNLVRNALQALGSQGRLVLRTRALRQYTINSHRHRLALALEIEDNGPGVPAELRDTLFYPLVSGREDGTGLGLAIAQDLVQRQGGLIECQSEPGRTVFSLVLPMETDR